MRCARNLALAAGLLVLGTLAADAAYLPSPGVRYNSAGQEVGDAIPGQPTIPVITTPGPSVGPFTAPQLTPPPGSRWGSFLSILGSTFSRITDGVNFLTFAPSNKGADPAQASAVVALSPNPALQCPFTAPVNQTANTTIIANPGGKWIHVCGIVLVSATQQGVSVSEGTGTTCGTGTAYWDGGSGGTVQTAANGGYAPVSDRIIYPMQARGDNVCVTQSGSGNVSGHINYGVFQ